MDYIIGVDIGTSGTKAVAFGVSGGVIADHHIGYPMLNPQPGYLEQDPETLFSAVMQSISHVVRTVNTASAAAKLLGVGFSSAMHGLIAMDAQHQPLTNCIIWADTRSEPFATGLKRNPLGQRIYLATGTPIHPMSPLCKLGWMREHAPAVYHAAHKFISIKEYVFLRFFGCYVVDESIASATGLFDINRLDWYGPALDLVGISPGRLSDPVPITHTLSGLDKRIAGQLRIPVDTPFIVGGSDGCLANLGSHAIAPGDAALTIGTSGAIRMVAGRPKTDDRARTFCYVLTKDHYVLGGAVNSGGMVLRWYRDNFGPVGGAEAYRLLAEEAATVAPGAEGLVFLPYLAGERAPHWNAEAKGLLFGMQLHHRKAHVTRAVFEGICYGMYSVGRALTEIAGPIRTLRANGGFARSPQWVQLLADIFQQEVSVGSSVEDAAKGAYMVVLKALGMIAGFGDVEEGSAPVVYHPDPANAGVYRKNFSLFERLYDKLKDEF